MNKFMEFRLGQVLSLKKAHPCGSFQWEVVRVGMDIGIRCQGCNRRILLPRSQLERRVRGGLQPGQPPQAGATPSETESSKTS